MASSQDNKRSSDISSLQGPQSNLEEDKSELSAEEMEGLCRSFALLDDDGDGVIDWNVIRELLSSWGRNPMNGELDQIMYYSPSVGCEGTPGIDMDGFEKYIKDQLEDTRDERRLREAFQAFDSYPPTGKLNVVELRDKLKHTGLHLTDAEIDFLYKEEYYWMLDENMLEYEQLINKILDKPNCNIPFLKY